MKKFYFLLLSFLALSLCANAAKKNVTLGSDWNTLFGTTYTGTFSTSADKLSLSGTVDDVSIDVKNGKSTNGYIKTGDFRAYNGYTVTLSTSAGKITSITSTAGGKKFTSGVAANVGELTISNNTIKWSGSAESVVLTFSGTVSFATITVTYDVPVAAGEVEMPTFSLASGTYYGTQEVTIQKPEGVARVLYTTDGKVPSSAKSVGVSITENTTITVSKTTTIKAIAVDASNNESAVASATYTILPSIANTKETALTTADAIALIDKTSAEQLADATQKVYVKGKISKIDNFNSTYGSITYWLDDNTFEVYGGLGLNNEKFTAIDNIVVGASVIVYGNVKKYNSTYEFDKNNYLVEYTAPATTQSIAINGNASKTEYLAGETFLTDGLEVVATLSDGSTLDVTNSAAWTIEPETLALGTTTVKVTATYKEFSASKDVAVTVSPAVTLDLTTTTQCTVETADKLEWNVSDIVTVTVDKASDSQTAANNYYPGAGNEYTRFYAKHSLTFTPAANYSIASITYNAKTTGYATALANSTWENATATADNKTVTIVPTDGTQPIVATISETTGATSMVIKYKELPIATEEGLDAVLLGEVGKKYQINCALYCHYSDGNAVYASTIGGGSTATAPTAAQAEEYWSDKKENFRQNDWVAIAGLDETYVGKEIEAGSVATYVENNGFPVIQFDSMNAKEGTEVETNTYRVANFNINNELVKKLWLVEPQPAEHCFVKGYVASLEDVVEADGLGVAEIKSGEKDVVSMYVNYNIADLSITATGWYLFEGIVVNGTKSLELNAVKANAGIETGVEGVEASSVKVYGAEGVINVVSEEVAPIAVYSANGAIVSSVEASSASIAVAPGFYIVKAGNSVSKVTVK